MKKSLFFNLPREFFALLIPFWVWLFLFRDLVFGKATIGTDTFYIYSVAKYFLDNLREGIYPLWNPFLQFGFPYINQLGESNPLFLVILILNVIGIGFYHAFLWSVLAYFFLGLFGFYLLVKIIYNDERVAYTAYVFLLFSFFGATIFNQITHLQIYVPVVWFFYFLLRFLKTWAKRFFLGMISMLVLIVTTYLPFYFLTFFLILALLFMMLFFRHFLSYGQGIGRFLKANLVTSLLAFCILTLSALSLWGTYRTLNDHVQVLNRHTSQQSKSSISVNLDEVPSTSALEGPLDINIANDELKSIPYDNDRFLYLSFFFYVIIALSCWTAFDRSVALWAASATLLFLISLGKATSVYPFLFEHVFYFKYFRNIYLLFPFLLSILSILAARQLDSYLKQLEEKKRSGWRLSWIIIVHLGILVFLLKQENVLASSYLTAAASFIFFMLYWFKRSWMTPSIFMIGIAILVLLQPSEVLSSFHEKSRGYISTFIRDAVKEDYAKLKFSYMRPDYKEVKFNLNEHEFFHHTLSRRDAPGFTSFQCCYPMEWSYQLARTLPMDVIGPYIQHKFIVYDEKKDGKELEDFFSLKASEPITGPSDSLSVLNFGVNTLELKTNFLKRKFLVYNDSFHDGWRAFVNGKEVPIFKANAAFKGVWIPAGQAQVRFLYEPWGKMAIYYLLLFWAFFGYTTYFFMKAYDKHKTSAQ